MDEQKSPTKFVETADPDDMTVIETFITDQLCLLYAMAEGEVAGSCFDMLVAVAIERSEGEGSR